MIEKIKNGLIVSCQATPEEPLHSSYIMGKMAFAAKVGGAVAIRAAGVNDIIQIKRDTDLPIIGLIKKNYKNSEVYITPTKHEVKKLLECPCDAIALDATLRERPDKSQLHELVKMIHEHGKLAMADVSTYEEAVNAEEVGFDLVSTTLSGYTSYSPQSNEPDYKLVKKCVKNLKVPVIAEGRISSPQQLEKMLKLNPFSVVIGSAITRPQLITKDFVAVMNKNKK